MTQRTKKLHVEWTIDPGLFARGWQWGWRAKNFLCSQSLFDLLEHRALRDILENRVTAQKRGRFTKAQKKLRFIAPWLRIALFQAHLRGLKERQKLESDQDLDEIGRKKARSS